MSFAIGELSCLGRRVRVLLSGALTPQSVVLNVQGQPDFSHRAITLRMQGIVLSAKRANAARGREGRRS